MELLGNPPEEPDSCHDKRFGTNIANIWNGMISNERIVKSEAFGFCSSLAFVSCVMLSSEDEDDIISSDEEDEHNAWNLFLEVEGQSLLDMLVESFLENEELAGTALSCHLSMDLLCQEMSDAWQSLDRRTFLFVLLREDSVLQTPGLQVLQQVQTVQHWWCCNHCNVATTPLSQSTIWGKSSGQDRCAILTENGLYCLAKKLPDRDLSKDPDWCEFFLDNP